ncbi:MAG: glutamine amidotransferase [Candidatus Saccharibacteria bacterium]|nr:glutamine amidotransferase [Candidatus Saccharibacteria bacterium]
MNSKTITILNLYSNDMNIYGDSGNVLCIKRRLQWSGYEPRVIEYNQGDKFPMDVDIIIGGGGQDSGQEKIKADLIKIGPKLKKLADDGVSILMICGLYQLFGKFFKTSDGEIIEGIGLLDIETFGKSERLIGNIVTHSEQFGDIIGYENHSGQTYLGHKVQVFGRVRIGAGNNTSDISEGARYKNVIGSYMHGSLLPKNPAVADYLIEQAVKRKYNDYIVKGLDNTYAEMARKIAAKRPR